MNKRTRVHPNIKPLVDELCRDYGVDSNSSGRSVHDRPMIDFLKALRNGRIVMLLPIELLPGHEMPAPIGARK